MKKVKIFCIHSLIWNLELDKFFQYLAPRKHCGLVQFKQEFFRPPDFKKVQSQQKKVTYYQNFVLVAKGFDPKTVFFTGFDIKKSLAFGSTFLMSHPAKNRFPISTFPYLNTIWRTNSYDLTLFSRF